MTVTDATRSPWPGRALAFAAPVAVGAAGVAAWPLAGDRLPARVATHWGPSGTPDGASDRGTAAATFAIGIGIAALVAAAGLVARRRRHDDAPATASVSATVGAFVAGLLGTLSVGTVVANLDATNWQDADLPLVVLVAAPVVAVGCGALVAWATAPRPADAPGAAPVPEAGPPASRTAWAGTAHARWAWLTAAAAAVGAAAVLPLAPVVSLALAFLAASVGWVASLRVTVGVHGVRVRSGVSPWPSVHLPLATIAASTAIKVRPREWGGWGYRGSLRLFRRAAWVLRRGPGLRVDLRDGRTFVVTVDQPEEAVAVLTTLLPAPRPAYQPDA
jgi:hypothetical protein